MGADALVIGSQEAEVVPDVFTHRIRLIYLEETYLLLELDALSLLNLFEFFLFPTKSLRRLFSDTNPATRTGAAADAGSPIHSIQCCHVL
ncbi:hypothetical protein R1flu_023052 [Riccia fluitans]|uniref:Uncharacterized protein n=1 Tax=Riccia fluitans TaxID=41844 RepID=A0ABD1XQX8_9MARC